MAENWYILGIFAEGKVLLKKVSQKNDSFP